MPNDALELVRLRNNFYRDNYRKVVGALLIALVAIIALVGAVAYLVMNRPSPTYFATTNSGRIIPLVPLDEPLVTSNSLLEWAATAAMQAYSFNFVDYRKQLQDSRSSFTEDGWKSFMSNLKDSGNLDSVIKKQLIVNAVPGGAPVIVNQGVLNGRYAWRVQMPMLVTYRSSSQSFHNTLMVNVLIVRVSTVINPKGIAIAQINYTQS